MALSHSTMAAAVLLSVACLALCLAPAAGHGFLAAPVSRNVYAHQQGTFYDHMSGNGLGNGNTGGPGEQQPAAARL